VSLYTLVVAEKQKRGALHFHAEVVGFQDVALIRRIWLSMVWDGSIDVQYRGGKKGILWERNRLAGYLSNYISKAFDLECFTGRHRYRCLKHIEVVKRIYYLPYANGAEAYLFKKLISRIAGLDVAYMWQPPGLREQYGWACTLSRIRRRFQTLYARLSQHVEMPALSVLLDVDGRLIYAMFPSPHDRSWMSVTAVGKPDGSV
jgi:hypothetical protein